MALGAALPTLAALGYYVATGDPTIRPLGISKTALDRFIDPSAPTGIVVTVHWVDPTGLRQSTDELQSLIARSLDAYGADYSFDFQKTTGNRVMVTYSVGGQVIGTFPASRAVKGISAAAEALRRSRAYDGVDEES